MTNKEISGAFKLLAQLIELHGDDSFKAKTYSNASFQIGRISDPIKDMPEDLVAQQKGVGKSVLAKIKELLETGTIANIEAYLAETPNGVLDLLRIKGIGAKKIRLLWQELEIESIGALLYACNENRLIELKGFGAKTQQSIIEQIHFINANSGKYLYAQLEDYVEEIQKDLKAKLGIDNIILVGQMRRRMPDVDHVAFLIETVDYEKVSKTIQSEVESNEAWDETDQSIATTLSNGLKMSFHFASVDDFEVMKFKLTGTEKHVNTILEKAVSFKTEEEAYSNAGLTYVVPEMREDIEYPNVSPEELIKEEDIKGVVHNHSIWSDGLNTIEEMAGRCIESGYEYLVMSDHSKTAVYAGGLTIDEIKRQQDEIDALNEKLAPFHIFKSIESDILNDGALDYPEDVLSSFDFVIASVHSGLKMDETKAMDRLLRAVENPATRILGHPTGRLMLAREGYPVDHEALIKACAANNVCIELNANPRRLDIDWRWIPRCMEEGVLISINPDAHNLEGISDIKHGVYTARKGALTKKMTLNALSLEEFKRWTQL